MRRGQNEPVWIILYRSSDCSVPHRRTLVLGFPCEGPDSPVSTLLLLVLERLTVSDDPGGVRASSGHWTARRRYCRRGLFPLLYLHRASGGQGAQRSSRPRNPTSEGGSVVLLRGQEVLPQRPARLPTLFSNGVVQTLLRRLTASDGSHQALPSCYPHGVRLRTVRGRLGQLGGELPPVGPTDGGLPPGARPPCR
jgi:hypothetical protein